MSKILNLSKALQGVNTVSGVVYLQPGESKELDVNEIELAGLKRLDFIRVDGQHPEVDPLDHDGNGKKGGAKKLGPLPDGLEDMKRDDLDALAAERGVDITEAKNKGDVIAALQLSAE